MLLPNGLATHPLPISPVATIVAPMISSLFKGLLMMVSIIKSQGLAQLRLEEKQYDSLSQTSFVVSVRVKNWASVVSRILKVDTAPIVRIRL